MNLNDITAGAIGAINPNIQATVQKSLGYSTTAEDGTQVPAYSSAVTASIQVQALTNRDLQMIDSLNIQDEVRAIYLDGNWEGVLRPENKGGDLIMFNGQTWLVKQVLEQWNDFTKLAAVMQDAAET
jgi:hypothetical protein